MEDRAAGQEAAAIRGFSAGQTWREATGGRITGSVEPSPTAALEQFGRHCSVTASEGKLPLL